MTKWREAARAAWDAWLDGADFALAEKMDRLGEVLASTPAQADPWRDAVDDELVTIMMTAESYSSPKEAVRALIDWHCAVQIDPRVSSAAQALIERGKTEAQADPTCEWYQEDEDCDTWQTNCNHYFSFTDGTPQENKFTHCCFCGKRLVQHEWKEQESDDDE